MLENDSEQCGPHCELVKGRAVDLLLSYEQVALFPFDIVVLSYPIVYYSPYVNHETSWSYRASNM